MRFRINPLLNKYGFRNNPASFVENLAGAILGPVTILPEPVNEPCERDVTHSVGTGSFLI